MDSLFLFQQNILRGIDNNFRRYLLSEINWNQRMIGIRGPRGAGKTTLLLQHLKYDLNAPENALYVTADHTWFYSHRLLDTAMTWYQLGGRVLLVDEVHKYPQWSRELKNIYDGIPEMQVIFSASSALDIYRGEADLSRRVISYNLAGLSFREYLQFSHNLQFDPIKLDEIVAQHRSLVSPILQQMQPLKYFNQYLVNGYLAIIAEGEAGYLPKLQQIINAIVDVDLAYIASYNSGTAVKVKRLLSVLAESAPFKPNISGIAQKLDLSRDSVYQYLYQLVDAKLLNVLTTQGKGVSRLQKPDKVYLENTNLIYALTPKPDAGNLRETFLLTQLLNTGHVVSAPASGDFLVNDLVIEVGGRSKTAAQVKGNSRYVVAADGIETGIGTKVPLWLFGFLY